MQAWQDLEAQLPHCGGELSLWAPREDSLDVAEAMELEGLKTPVRLLNPELQEALGWQKIVTPVKVLFNGRCEAVEIMGPGGGPKQSRAMIEKILAQVRAGDKPNLLRAVVDERVPGRRGGPP
ncbi:MAG: hypothetical protein AB1744_10805 [Candidatus Zixiibacteriota bacterium]